MKNSKPEKVNLQKLSAVVGVSVAALSMPVFADSVSYDLNIKAQRTDVALLELAQESGVQIIFSPELVMKNHSPVVKGSFSIEQAVEALLKGSNLSYRIDSDNVVLINEKPADDNSSNDIEGNNLSNDVESDNSSNDIEEVVVTGSLIRNGSPTSPNIIITRQEIDQMGAYTIEDVLRRIPQNVASLNRASSRDAASVGARFSITDSLGNVGINLRGLGIGNTLVLVDGRRTSTSPISENGFVNLSTIPMSSVERIDLILDGASAIYGSDAIGGVINIITKKDYSGSETNLRYENGRNGGSRFILGQTMGFGWDSGNLMANISVEEYEAVSQYKAGFVTKDQRAITGFDDRLSGSFHTSPGWLTTNGFSSGRIGSLPLGHDGVDWTNADLNVENTALAVDLALQARDNTPETKSENITVNFRQSITDSVEAFGRIIYSKSDNTASNIPFRTLYIEGTNPYNNYDADGDGVSDPIWVHYAFINETLSGQIEKTTSNSEQERYDMTLGFTADIFDGWRLDVEGQWAESSSDSFDTRYFDDQWLRAENPETGRLEYTDPDGNLLGTRIPISERYLSEFGELVATSLNVFGNGSVQDVSGLRRHLTELFFESPVSTSTSFQAKADGTLFSVAGGDVSLGMGAQWQEHVRDYSGSERRIVNRDFSSPQTNFITAGTLIEVEQTITSLFAELQVPLVGADNSLPGVESLLLVVSGRYDDYDLPQADNGNGASFTNVSPKVGFMWQPAGDVTVRLNWSEAFRAPTFKDLLDAPDYDPDEPLTNANSYEVTDPVNGETYRVARRLGGNPDLEPEVATIYTAGIEWSPEFLHGLFVSVNYNDTSYDGRIGQLRFNRFRAPDDQDFDITNPALAPRGDDGRIIYLHEAPINLSISTSRTFDFTLQYDFDTEWGAFNTSLHGTRVLERDEQLLAGAEIKDLVADESGVDEWRVVGQLGWQRDNYGLNLFAYYSSAWTQEFTGRDYDFALRQFVSRPAWNVESHVTFDLTGHYTFEDVGVNVQLGAKNLLNTSFPYVARQGAAPWDSSRVDDNGRVVYLNVRKAFEF